MHNNINLQPGTFGLMLASNHPKKKTGRKIFKETRHPIYRGIRKRVSGKWVCEVRQPNKRGRIWLGTYLTAEMAARAHDVAVIALRGKLGGCLNFADSVWRLPVPATSDIKDIQKAAAEAADAFRPAIVKVQSHVVDVSITQKDEIFVYEDDDMVFGMPWLLDAMYNGMGMSPPSNSSGYGYKFDDDDGYVSDVSLWS